MMGTKEELACMKDLLKKFEEEYKGLNDDVDLFTRQVANLFRLQEATMQRRDATAETVNRLKSLITTMESENYGKADR